jgi:PHD/YefM family antitoxin component YafN of YafNO toxin-antitoxin module
MAIQTFSSRDFTRDVSSAKRAAHDGPVFITDRGRPAFALLNIEDYYRMTKQGEGSLLAAMKSIPCEQGIDFDPKKIEMSIRPAPLI